MFVSAVIVRLVCVCECRDRAVSVSVSAVTVRLVCACHKLVASTEVEVVKTGGNLILCLKNSQDVIAAKPQGCSQVSLIVCIIRCIVIRRK